MGLISLIIVFHLLRGCFTKEIFISQSESSKDEETCGNSTRACRTIGYALSKIQDVESIVNIDGGRDPESPFVYLVEGQIKTNHSMVLQKWERNHNKTISPKPILHKQSGRPGLITSGNITLVSIEFASSGHSVWVLLENSCKKFNITNCSFEAKDLINLRSDVVGKSSHKFLDLYVWNSRVEINVDVFEFKLGLLSSAWILMHSFDNHIFVYDSIIVGNDSSIHIDALEDIVFSNCTFENLKILEIIAHIHVLVLHNSNFKSMCLMVECGIANLTNNIFSNTTVNIDILSSFWNSLRFVTNDVQPSAFIYNTSFVNVNPEKRRPAVTIKGFYPHSTKIVLIRCSFRNNTSFDHAFASSLHIDRDKANKGTSVRLEDCDFQASRNNETVFKIFSNNTQFSGTSVTCKNGDYLYKEKTNKNYLQGICQPCEKSTYYFSGKTFIKNSNIISCIPCPYNSVCEKGRIRLKGGYWGYVDTRNDHIKTLSLLACPAYYCCPSIEHCTSYNTCSKHRRGRLCSKCLPGFSSDISTKYQCTHNSKCHSAKIVFVVYTVLAVLFIVMLLYLKEIMLFVKNFVKQSEEEDEHTANENEDIDLYDDNGQLQLRERLLHESFIRGDPRPPSPYQVLHTNDIISENYRKNSSNMISGILKILFFFYQAAALIRIQSADKIELIFPTFFDFVSTSFNIKLDLTHSKMTLCIIPDLNVIQVKIIKLGFIFIALSLLMILWLVTCIWKTVKYRKEDLPARSGTTYTQIDDDIPSYCNPPFIVRVKCVYVQFLLITYASIATFSFDAVHCVDINGESYLYTQASIKCYKLWQYGMIVFIALWVVPFSLSLYIGTKLLHKCSINPTQFLLMLSFPPTILGILLKRKCYIKRKQLRTEEAMLAKHLLLVVNEPFRDSTATDGSKLCWETVLILRRMLLVIAQTFIMSPILKLYPITFFLLVCLSHHLLMKPFANAVLNIIEGFSLRILTSLVVVNIFWAFTREYAVMKNPIYNLFGKVVVFYEMFILSLPFILVAFYMVYGIVCMLYRVCKRIYNAVRYKQD